MRNIDTHMLQGRVSSWGKSRKSYLVHNYSIIYLPSQLTVVYSVTPKPGKGVFLNIEEILTLDG